jgi:hypothetical protein
LSKLFDGPKSFKTLEEQLSGKYSRATINKYLGELFTDGMVTRQGRRGPYQLTEKGLDHLTCQRIREEAGFIGLDWADDKTRRGFKVRLLSDLTNLPQHKRWLFAWNPQTGECDLAAIFGVRSLISKKGAPRYYAQLVDREKSPDKPLKKAELFDFLRENVVDWGNEADIKKALRQFWNLENFNAYLCAFVPEEINFGFPAEIGHFSCLMFVGFGYQKHFPFIPQMPIVAGGFNLSENLAVQLNYYVNLMMMHIWAWLTAKKLTNPTSVSDETLELAKASTFDAKIGIVCKNRENGKCKRTNTECVAKTDGKLDFSRCPILLEETKQVEIKYSEK